MKYLTFACGWMKEGKHGSFISCSAKGDYARMWDADAKEGSTVPVELVIRTKDTGEELVVERFMVTENGNKSQDSHPDYDLKLKIED